MWYLYLDESGDLGFDFVNKKPSKFFTVTILALTGKDNDKQLIKEANVTLRRKLNPPNKRKRLITELKGNGTTIAISHQFKGLQIADVFSWGIFRKYEKNDTEWYDFFSEKIAYEEIYK